MKVNHPPKLLTKMTTHTVVEATASRYHGRDVLRISGRLKLVQDAAAMP